MASGPLRRDLEEPVRQYPPGRWARPAIHAGSARSCGVCPRQNCDVRERHTGDAAVSLYSHIRVAFMDIGRRARNSAFVELARPYFRWAYYRLFPDRRPGYFSDCWNYRSCELGRDVLPDAWTACGNELDVLFFPMTDWHTRIQRTQHLARALADRGHRCIYINPHLGCEYLSPYLVDPHSRISLLLPRIFEFHIHVPREHVFHRRLLSAKESRRIVAAIQELMTALRIRRAIQFVSFPIWLDAAKALRAAVRFPIVYDCHDYLAGFENVDPEIIRKEADVFEACDPVIFSSQHLMETTTAAFPQVRGKALLSRNAVDASHFASRIRPASSAPQSGTVVGYAGSLDHWFDVAAVRRAAQEHGDWKFVLIGRIEDRRVNALGECPNVEFTGEIPHSELPAYLASFSVAIIPFLRNNLTLAANPIKLYEYFSLGLPVVSARLPEVELYRDLVYLADDPATFSAQLVRAIQERDPSLRQRRMAVAQQESWLARAAELSEAFERQVRELELPKALLHGTGTRESHTA